MKIDSNRQNTSALFLFLKWIIHQKAQVMLLPSTGIILGATVTSLLVLLYQVIQHSLRDTKAALELIPLGCFFIPQFSLLYILHEDGLGGISLLARATLFLTSAACFLLGGNLLHWFIIVVNNDIQIFFFL